MFCECSQPECARLWRVSLIETISIHLFCTSVCFTLFWTGIIGTTTDDGCVDVMGCGDDWPSHSLSSSMETSVDAYASDHENNNNLGGDDATL